MSPPDKEVGYFEPFRLAITVAREPEIGLAWEATCSPLGLSALGKTPKEAAHSLVAFISKRGIAGTGRIYGSACDKLEADDG